MAVLRLIPFAMLSKIEGLTMTG